MKLRRNIAIGENGDVLIGTVGHSQYTGGTYTGGVTSVTRTNEQGVIATPTMPTTKKFNIWILIVILFAFLILTKR